MTDGILVLNKPQNWTSHDCVAVCRRVLGIKRVGHGGTLDPMAEGVLPVFIGKATRIMQYMDLDFKTYICKAKLGISTDTQDIWGETLENRSTEGISEEDIRNALNEFKGEITQIPPKYSALKVNGMKLYEYARKGIEVEIKSRKVFIKELIIHDIDMENMEAAFEVTCSKGTYIRSICSDLGEKLGCGAAMSYLKRTGSGVFTLENAVSPEDLKTMELSDIEKYVMPVDRPLVHFHKAVMKADRAKYFASGNSIRWHQVQIEEISDDDMAEIPSAYINGGDGEERRQLYRVYRQEDGRFLGTGYYCREENVLKADKIFVTRQEI